MSEWSPDVLEGYEQRTIPLGADPDGEGDVEATLVRRTVRDGEAPTRAVLYVHGFTDYFFQTALADFLAERGFAFHALDLRKCGRSLRDGQVPHYVSDLALYDAELDRALEIVREETGGADVVLMAHSTGGLVLPLWLARRDATALGVRGLVLNSPWFDLQGAAWMRGIGTQVIKAVAKVQPARLVPLPDGDAYGASISASAHGEWDYELAWKPVAGFPVSFGWLNAIRDGHARLHEGLDVGTPSLVLRSRRTHFSRRWSEQVDAADAVLDTRQIARWAGCLGDEVTMVPIEGGRHDLFLSTEGPRKEAYATLDRWLAAHDLVA